METRERLEVTSVVVSHHLPSIFRISDRVAMLHQGEIIIYGTPEEVQASPDPRVQEFIHPEGGAQRPIQRAKSPELTDPLLP